MTLMVEPAFRLEELLDTGKAVINEQDAFDKWDKHAMEKEYRIALETGEKSTDAVCLDIGDICDIAVPVRASEVRKTVDNLLIGFKVAPSLDEYVGNTSREQMCQDFYNMGNGMVNIMLVCGGIAEYEEDTP